MTIHPDHPFATPLDERDPARRLRGRLASGVTVLTAGDVDQPAGITVSSLFVVEGDEPLVVAIIGVGSDFVDRLEETGRFVMHVLGESDQPAADVFAGIRPAPGGMFAGFEVETSAWGPRLAAVGSWAGCRSQEVRPLGDQLLVVGTMEEIMLADLWAPLIWFRGGYRRLAR